MPAGRKVRALTELLGPEGFQVIAPDLNVPSFRNLDFQAIARRSLGEASQHAPVVIVGSSLGAVAALEANRLGARAPLLLIAPAIGFGRRWTEKLPPEILFSSFIMRKAGSSRFIAVSSKILRASSPTRVPRLARTRGDGNERRERRYRPRSENLGSVGGLRPPRDRIPVCRDRGRRPRACRARRDDCPRDPRSCGSSPRRHLRLRGPRAT